MRPLASRQRALVGALAALVVASTLPPTVARADVGGRWMLPVDGQVLRPFQAPLARFGPGHRGVDLAAAPGTPVRAAGTGVVSFAGDVAGALHVVVAHDGGLRTSYSFLASISVRAGQSVAKGDVVGTAGGSGEGHGPGVLHFGLRVGDEYVDPMLLFRPRDLTELVRLVPADERRGATHSTAKQEARDLFAFFGGKPGNGGCGFGTPFGEIDVCTAAADAADWAGEQVEAALDAGLDLLRRAGEAGAALAEQLAGPLHDLLHEVAHAATEVARRALLASPLGLTLETVVVVGDWIIRLTQDCDPHAPAADGTGGSGNRLFAVAGIDSHRKTANANANGLDWQSLGYRRDEVDWFSYKPGSNTYGKADTYNRIMFEARSMGEQLKEEARRDPGRAIDLIGHSLGGVVVRAFLDKVYRGHEAEFPPIGKVITFASPLEGTPLATLDHVLHRTPMGGVVDAIDHELHVGPPSDAPVMLDLSELSKLIREINRRPPPGGIRILSLSGWFDPVVPATSTEGRGVTRHTVTAGDPVLPDDHSAILRDADALRAARAYLEGRDLPCQGALDHLAGKVAPFVIDRVEHLGVPLLT